MSIQQLRIEHFIAGLVAVLVGYASSAAIVFQAAHAAGATQAQMSSWLWALGLGMGLTSIGLSLYYRAPVLTAWSTPGAALLATSLTGVSLSDATGAFLVSALLIIISGVTGWFERIMTRIPLALASALLAGVLVRFGLDTFISLQAQPLLVGMMVLTYLVAKRWLPRYAVVLVLGVGIALAYSLGLLHWEQIPLVWTTPVWVTPTWNLAVILSVGIPLFIVTMTSQNIPGIAAIRASGYTTPISPTLTWTGLATLVLAPFGGYALNLAAITAAICMSKEAGEDPQARYWSAVIAGILYCITGLLGATVVALLLAFPKELIIAVAGLALLGTIGNSLMVAMKEDSYREPALITFLVTASGISLGGIGSAFWALVAGVLALVIAKWLPLKR
ncbi:MAG: benzoate/H(+) symporter BenE family transporter [Thiofilum sp.]|uniref:benzoate/H(+) symporter BenE family transporter n=1 Tax=Thiofilum sp. TaxID=2212733 RepID=UPI0025EF6B70|nr:benzoate/H(+) symporter BenE family transporter [Thiofilum sp.]MBK8454800.1 benzoate/H(+) symporter BenE family transporter [Thiofilum sp.]